MRVGFGELRLDSETRRLERRGEPVHLTPKAFLLLETLLAARPKALSKEELCDRLWPDVIVDEGNLANLAAEIRSAIAAAGGDPAVIRTVRRFGYAFDGHAFAFDGGAAAVELPTFVLRNGDRAIPLHDGVNLLGRARRSVVPVDSRSVSRRHAQIVVDSGAAILEDLGSRSGTFVGASRVSGAVALRAGDRILLGSELIGTIEIVDPPESTITESRARS